MTDRDKFIEEHLTNLGKRLKEVRKAKGHTSYEKFAFENDLDRSLYGKYEKGKNMKLDTFFKILHGLGITAKEFFSEGFENDDS